MKRRVWSWTVAMIVCSCAAGALALAQAQDSQLPSGKDVYEKFIAATGGRATYEKIKSRVTSAKMELPAQGIKGTLTMYQVAPASGYMVIDLPGAGMIERGTDGTVVWETNPMTGPRIMSGQEREQALREMKINSELNPDQYYDSIETKSLEDVNGKPCYRVDFVSKTGVKESRWYDKDSGLLVKGSVDVQSQMGPIHAESTVDDYRDVDGLKVPFKTTQTGNGLTFVVTMEKMEHNVDVPKEKLALPEDVKKLLAKQATQPAAESGATTQPAK